MQPVKSLDELKECIKNGKHDFFIALNGGLRSSKTIYYNGANTWKIFHHIDDTWQTCNQKTFEQSFVYEALIKKALYCYD